MGTQRRILLSVLSVLSFASTLVWGGLLAVACTSQVSIGVAEEDDASFSSPGFGLESGVADFDSYVDPYPFHNAGQACLVCHSATFNVGATPFLLAGTVFDSPTDDVGVSGADLIFIDSTGAGFSTTTNCVGNFYVLPSEYAPVFPLHVTISGGASQGLGEMQSMQGAISASATDCATCHTFGSAPATGDAGALGQPIFLGSAPLAQDPNCPFDASVMFSP